MMTLYRYMLFEAIRPTMVALAVMLGVVWLLQSLRFLDLIINKGLGVEVFLRLTLLLVPMLLTVIVPLAVFAGCCYAFRRWQDDNELTAVLASGHGPWVLLRPALLWGLVAVAFGYWLYLFGLPYSTRAFKDLQFSLRTQDGQLLLEEGTFNQLGDNMMVYLKKRTTPTTLEMILVHDTRNPAQPVTWFAQHGEVTVGEDGYPRLELKNGLRQEVGPEQVGMLEFKSYVLDIRQRLGMKALEPRSRNREEYLLAELWANAAQSADVKERNQLVAEAHKRLLWPLTPLPMVALAAGFLLRAPTRNSSSFRQLVAAGVAALGYVGGLMVMLSLAQGGHGWALWSQWLLLPVAILVALVAAGFGRKRGRYA